MKDGRSEAERGGLGLILQSLPSPPPLPSPPLPSPRSLVVLPLFTSQLKIALCKQGQSCWRESVQNPNADGQTLSKCR